MAVLVDKSPPFLIPRATLPPRVGCLSVLSVTAFLIKFEELIVSTNASSASAARYQLGNRMCYGSTAVFGGGKWYVITTTQTTGDAQYQFYAIQIDSFGIVQNSLIWNCSTGGGNI